MSQVAKPIAASELRVVYLAGPGDAPAVLRNMADGRDVDDVAHVAYSRQMFEVCEQLGVHLLSMSTQSRKDDFTYKTLRAATYDNLVNGKSGLAFHVAQVPLALEIVRAVKEFRANVVVLSPPPYAFLLEPLALLGVKIVPALHATLWPEFTPPSRPRKLVVNLDQRLFAHDSYAIMSHPGVTVRQVLELTGGKARPVVEFLPLFRREMFEGIKGPDSSASTFRVMTVGRVEANKGVFDLIEVARRVRELGVAVHFDVCGTGSALEEARHRVADLSLNDHVTLHGWTKTAEMKRLWGESHLALIPTTSDFVEGFNQVVIEALLAGRPVVTSRVCPALEFVKPCAIEVDVDDVQGYVDALVGLANDRSKYDALRSRADEVTAPFLDPASSFGAAVRRVFNSIIEGSEVTPIAHPETPSLVAAS